jgi:hypothetical protein
MRDGTGRSPFLGTPFPSSSPPLLSPRLRLPRGSSGGVQRASGLVRIGGARSTRSRASPSTTPLQFCGPGGATKAAGAGRRLIAVHDGIARQASARSSGRRLRSRPPRPLHLRLAAGRGSSSDANARPCLAAGTAGHYSSPRARRAWLRSPRCLFCASLVFAPLLRAHNDGQRGPRRARVCPTFARRARRRRSCGHGSRGALASRIRSHSGWRPVTSTCRLPRPLWSTTTSPARARASSHAREPDHRDRMRSTASRAAQV